MWLQHWITNAPQTTEQTSLYFLQGVQSGIGLSWVLIQATNLKQVLDVLGVRINNQWFSRIICKFTVNVQSYFNFLTTDLGLAILLFQISWHSVMSHHCELDIELYYWFRMTTKGLLLLRISQNWYKQKYWSVKKKKDIGFLSCIVWAWPGLYSYSFHLCMSV